MTKNAKTTCDRSDSLIQAIDKGDQQLVVALLKSGANPNQTDVTGRSALFLAAGYGQIISVEHLLQNCADVNFQNSDGETALFAAASRGEFECVNLLLCYGADIEFVDDEHCDALTRAVENEHFQIAQRIKDHRDLLEKEKQMKRNRLAKEMEQRREQPESTNPIHELQNCVETATSILDRIPNSCDSVVRFKIVVKDHLGFIRYKISEIERQHIC